jgi:hypothetical protein
MEKNLHNGNERQKIMKQKVTKISDKHVFEPVKLKICCLGKINLKNNV